METLETFQIKVFHIYFYMQSNRENIGQRIKVFRKEKNLSVPQIERITGIPKDRIYKWEKGTTPYDTADYEKIEKLLNNKLESTETIHSAPKGRFPKKNVPGQVIPFYDVDFAAGDIEFYNGHSSIQAAYTMDIPEFSGCTAFRTYGDSMENLIKSGDILFGTKIEDWRGHLEYGQIYGIICNDKRRYLKYIRKAEKETHFLLKSENKNYDDFLIPKNKIKSIWLIHGWMNKRT